MERFGLVCRCFWSQNFAELFAVMKSLAIALVKYLASIDADCFDSFDKYKLLSLYFETI